MFLEITNKGLNYHERLHQKEFKSSEVEGVDEMVLSVFNYLGPMEDTALFEGISGKALDLVKDGIRRLFEAGYLEERQPLGYSGGGSPIVTWEIRK